MLAKIVPEELPDRAPRERVEEPDRLGHRLLPGRAVTEAELLAFARGRLAAHVRGGDAHDPGVGHSPNRRWRQRQARRRRVTR